MKTLKLMGYWYSKAEPYYPHPEIFVDENMDAEEKDWIIRYLNLSYVVKAYRGTSPCRFNCNADAGSCDNSDGEYLFPSGFVHYVQVHSVRPPQEFVDKVLASTAEISYQEENIQQIERERYLTAREDRKMRRKPAVFKKDTQWWLTQAELAKKRKEKPDV